jgi:outer membrane protein
MLPPIQPNFKETPLPKVVALPPPLSIPGDVPNRPLTAEEAAQIALRHQPGITIAHGALVSAEGQVVVRRAALKPTLAINGEYAWGVHPIFGGQSGAASGGGAGGGDPRTSTSWTASGDIRQLLFDFNHTRDLVRQAEALARQAGSGLTKAQSDTVWYVKQSFYTYVEDLALEDVNLSNVRDQQGHLTLAQARLVTGVGVPLDVVMAETAVSDAIFNLASAQNSASLARVNLALQMGIDPRTPIQPAPSSETSLQEHDVNALIDEAQRQRPEIVQAQKGVEAARYGVGAAKTFNAPSFSLEASQANTSLPTNSSTLGLLLSWDPFDGGLTGGMIKEAQGNLESSNGQLESARLSVVSDVTQAYLNLKTAEQKSTDADAEAFNARESLREAEGSYSAGVGVFLNVLDAQAALVTALTNQVNARSSLDQSRASLAHAVGK